MPVVESNKRSSCHFATIRHEDGVKVNPSSVTDAIASSCSAVSTALRSSTTPLSLTSALPSAFGDTSAWRTSSDSPPPEAPYPLQRLLEELPSLHRWSDDDCRSCCHSHHQSFLLPASVFPLKGGESQTPSWGPSFSPPFSSSSGDAFSCSGSSGGVDFSATSTSASSGRGTAGGNSVSSSFLGGVSEDEEEWRLVGESRRRPYSLQKTHYPNVHRVGSATMVLSSSYALRRRRPSSCASEFSNAVAQALAKTTSNAQAVANVSFSEDDEELQRWQPNSSSLPPEREGSSVGHKQNTSHCDGLLWLAYCCNRRQADWSCEDA